MKSTYTFCMAHLFCYRLLKTTKLVTNLNSEIISGIFQIWICIICMTDESTDETTINHFARLVFYCLSKQKVYTLEVKATILGNETFFSYSKHMSTIKLQTVLERHS
jgi:hypothetical protein